MNKDPSGKAASGQEHPTARTTDTADVKPIRDLPPHFRRRGGPPPTIGIPVSGPPSEHQVPDARFFIPV